MKLLRIIYTIILGAFWALVTVSIIFGLLRFAVNFRTINFAFPPYTATVLIGLMFLLFMLLQAIQ